MVLERTPFEPIVQRQLTAIEIREFVIRRYRRGRVEIERDHFSQRALVFSKRRSLGVEHV